jgi:hypothetical protein
MQAVAIHACTPPTHNHPARPTLQSDPTLGELDLLKEVVHLKGRGQGLGAVVVHSVVAQVQALGE